MMGQFLDRNCSSREIVRMKKIAATLLLTMTFLGNAKAQSIQKYFGYYYGDAQGVTISPPATALGEFQNSSNIYHIAFWSADESAAGRSASTQYLLSQLALAKAAHMHAIIPGYPFLFQYTPTSSSGGCYSIDTGASQAWNTVVQAMVSSGYINTTSPDESVVSAIYVVDEPNGTTSGCLADVSGAANPALQNAVTAVRSNANTAWLPLASILGGGYTNGVPNFANMSSGMQLFDWVGFDDYGITPSQWQSELSTLKSYAPSKKYILVPGAQSVYEPNVCVGTDSPTPFIQEMQSDPQAVWLAPFVWYSKTSSCLGVRDIPSLNATYTSIGTSIKAQGCSSSVAARNFCRPQSIMQVVNLILFSDND
jgi:hypothetical protein